MITKELPIDARIVALDHTHYWSIRDEDKPYISKIVSVYLYDKSQHVHCCELTPSYELLHLYDAIRMTDLGEDEERYEELAERYLDSCDSQDCYVHVRSIDRIEASDTPTTWNYSNCGEHEIEDNSRDGTMESLREHYRANQQI